MPYVQAAIAQIGLVMHPVGSIYMSVNSTNPGDIFGGTWEKLPGGVFLRNAGGNAGTVGATQGESLPNIWGEFPVNIMGQDPIGHNGSPKGAFAEIERWNMGSYGGSFTRYYGRRWDFNAARYNGIYNGSHVTPINVAVHIWKRTA